METQARARVWQTGERPKNIRNVHNVRECEKKKSHAHTRRMRTTIKRETEKVCFPLNFLFRFAVLFHTHTQIAHTYTEFTRHWHVFGAPLIRAHELARHHAGAAKWANTSGLIWTNFG